MSTSHDAFIASLIQHLSHKPTVSLNPHCLSEWSLHRLFDEIFSQGNRPFGINKKKTREWLEEIGLLKTIVVERGAVDSKRRTRFYRLDILQPTGSQPNPLELLQAYAEQGVICYFTAIAFHSMTTQPPAHHHVAIPAKPRDPPTVSRPPAKLVSPGDRESDPLGTWLFSYQGLRYYLTSREKRLLPGIQSRYLNPTSLIRITTLEQTLLDTLHRPLSCGGPSVVMEAWEQGLRRMDEERLASYLREMNYLPTAQKLGYLLESLSYRPGPDLARVIEDFRSRLNPEDPSLRRQLFPGMEYTHLKMPWLIYAAE